MGDCNITYKKYLETQINEWTIFSKKRFEPKKLGPNNFVQKTRLVKSCNK